MLKPKLKIGVCAAAVSAVLCGSAFAGQEPYVAIVGPDTEIGKFYISPKMVQFTHEFEGNEVCALETVGINCLTPTGRDDACELFGAPPGCFGANPIGNCATLFPNGFGEVYMCEGPEEFNSVNATPEQSEVCNVDYLVDYTKPTHLIPHDNPGSYEWVVELPKKPLTNFMLVLQCGMLKPNALFDGAGADPLAILTCAGVAGEKLGIGGDCIPLATGPGVNPINEALLPTLEARGLNVTTGNEFMLTAYRDPGTHALSGGNPMTDSESLQVLDGTIGARIDMVACTPKTVHVKIPVNGQVNAAGQVEGKLERLDVVKVKLNLPEFHPLDWYCNEDSLKVVGTGVPIENLLQRWIPMSDNIECEALDPQGTCRMNSISF